MIMILCPLLYYICHLLGKLSYLFSHFLWFFCMLSEVPLNHPKNKLICVFLNCKWLNNCCLTMILYRIWFENHLTCIWSPNFNLNLSSFMVRISGLLRKLFFRWIIELKGYDPESNWAISDNSYGFKHKILTLFSCLKPCHHTNLLQDWNLMSAIHIVGFDKSYLVKL